MPPRSQNSKTPLIGIFWIHEGKVLHASMPAVEGEVYDEFLVCPLDHVKYWKTLQKLHTELRGLEYEQVPRGRIMFLPKTNEYRVLLDRLLMKPRWKRELLRVFQLPAKRTTFLPDPHYTTDSAALDELFR